MPDLLRQEIATAAHTMIVKVGTRVLTAPDGTLSQERIAHLAQEIHEVLASGRKLVLVSSGAVGAGMGQLGLKKTPHRLGATTSRRGDWADVPGANLRPRVSSIWPTCGADSARG